MDLDYEEMSKMVKNMAASVSANFPPYVTKDDAEAAIWIWIYEKKSWIQKILEDGPEGFNAKIFKTMRKVAFDHCNKEKAAAEGYSPDDVYKYSIIKVRTLLADVFQYQDWQTFGSHGDGQPMAKGLANQTGDRVTELIDVKVALGKMHRDAQDLLILQFKYGYSMDAIAIAMDINLEAAKKRSQRALKGLQRQLGYWDPSESPNVSKRKVMSNAAARAAASNSYEG